MKQTKGTNKKYDSFHLGTEVQIEVVPTKKLKRSLKKLERCVFRHLKQPKIVNFRHLTTSKRPHKHIVHEDTKIATI